MKNHYFNNFYSISFPVLCIMHCYCMGTRTALISPNVARLYASQKPANLENTALGTKRKNTWSGGTGILLPRDFYHLSAMCVRLQISNINGVCFCFCFSGPTGRHYCTKEVIVSIWASQAPLLPHHKPFVIKASFPSEQAIPSPDPHLGIRQKSHDCSSVVLRGSCLGSSRWYSPHSLSTWPALGSANSSSKTQYAQTPSLSRRTVPYFWPNGPAGPISGP